MSDNCAYRVLEWIPLRFVFSSPLQISTDPSPRLKVPEQSPNHTELGMNWIELQCDIGRYSLSPE